MLYGGGLEYFMLMALDKGKKSLIPVILENLKSEKLPDFKTPTHANDYIFIDDVLMAFANAINNNITSGIYNLGSGKSTTVIEIARIAENVVLGTNHLSLKLENEFQDSKSKIDFWADIEGQ